MRSIKTRIAAGLAVAALALSLTTGPALAAPKAQQVNQGNLISALNNIAVQIEDLQALNDLTVQDVRVVNVEDVLNNNRVLNNALNRNDVDINVLRDFLNNNNTDVAVTLRNILNNNDVAINDVVAINVLSGGEVVVFTQ